MKAVSFQAALIAVTGCTSDRIAVHVAGHPFATDLDCQRTKPVGTFDAECDHPKLGYRGGHDPTIGIPSIGRGGFGH